MKRTMTVLLAAVFVLALGWSAMAADELCNICPKCGTYNIKCCYSTTSGQTTGECDTYFDWEEYFGYCQSKPYNYGCKLVFDICECGEDPDNDFSSGALIGVRMTIETAGVYFTDDSIPLRKFTSLTDACAATVASPTDGVYTPSNLVYYDADGKTIDPSLLATRTDYATCGECEPPCDGKAVKLETKIGYGIAVTAADVCLDAGGNSIPGCFPKGWWWFDIPAMVKSKTEITAEDLVKVEVCILSTKGGGICSTCQEICCCEVTVGVLCCETSVSGGCIYFPYVLYGDAVYKSGISVANVNNVSNMTLTFTFINKNGGSSSVDVDIEDSSVASKVNWVDWIEGIPFDPAPTAGPGILKVSSLQGPLDGLLFIFDPYTGFGGTTLARCCGDRCYN